MSPRLGSDLTLLSPPRAPLAVAAAAIIDAFETHHAEFLDISRRATHRFETPKRRPPAYQSPDP
jgi:hypothetical protein